MKFTPTKKEDWKKTMKETGYPLLDKELDLIYREMCRDAIFGLMAMTALGGKFTADAPDFTVFGGIKGIKEELAQRMLSNDLDVNPCEIDAGLALEYFMNKFFNGNEEI